MDTNQEIFIKLLQAGLWEREVKIPAGSNVDWGQILRLAEEQSVVGLMAAATEHVKGMTIPQEWALQFIGEALVIEQRNKAMNAFVGKLMERLQGAGIRALLLKGQGIGQCYERPLWRTCGDVDLFLNEEDYVKAKELLLPSASSVEEEHKKKKHQGMTIDGWVVELHGRLYNGLSSRVERVMDDIRQDTFCNEQVRSWMNGKSPIILMKAENDAFYVFTHILVHFYKGGIGLRQICDWCRLLYTYKDTLNHELLESRIKKAGLMTEWKAFGALAVKYLGMNPEYVPFMGSMFNVQCSMLFKKADRIMEFVMMSGNFGHNRDMSYYSKYPYLMRKCISMGRRISDLFRHARIFPMDSLLFSFSIINNGIRSAVRGE